MWDRQGRQFELAREVGRAEAEAMLADDNVQVAIYDGTQALDWVEPKDRLRIWRDRVGPRLHDNPEWRPPPDAPGTLPFVPELWQEVNGTTRTLIFNDRD